MFFAANAYERGMDGFLDCIRPILEFVGQNIFMIIFLVVAYCFLRRKEKQGEGEGFDVHIKDRCISKFLDNSVGLN